MDISFLPGVQFDYTTNRFFDLVDVVINPFIGVFARVEANHVTLENLRAIAATRVCHFMQCNKIKKYKKSHEFAA